MITTRLEIPGGWSERDIPVGPRLFRLILPADPDKFLDHLESQEGSSEPVDPYWGALWSTAPVMAKLVVQHPWPDGLRALELGCGAGLVGLAALAAGLDVTFSDLVPAAVELALENARRNGFPAPQGLALDWRHPPDLQFPLILASDVLYDTALHQPLLNLLARMLTARGRCWIGDPGRSAARTFVQRATAQGFSLQVRDEDDRPMLAPSFGKFALFELKRAGDGR